MGGKAPGWWPGGLPDGARFFVLPPIFAHADNVMTSAREEIFGLVGTVIPRRLRRRCLDRQHNAYRHAVTMWTKDVTAAHSLAAQVQAGAVWVNGWTAIGAALPGKGRHEEQRDR
ncbi:MULTISPECIES: aldehyde dehydrogenase family protein [Rhodococcus]|uniref:Aldehyde dehydrogenase family protein n=1 Tax=Rhodococcus qingshengii JCM 15477 TaxID=1303681 RepID=A0AB38RR29_RHOSG|nr:MULTISPECIES: aldehyde dehydrogenase family protein [Rhodococcus]MCC4306725.1 aldehyde dehydrogenase family protein [Rhodococcus sp. 3-2]OMQ28750.1 hypothetical protein BK799_29165 [Rhodococcus sp. D-1]UPU47034.1 aldehyde dehydrogenase family protein [Rhodococcus qingshengii JCM 15477]